MAKFDVTGTLVYSTYFHGGAESATGIVSIAADAAGNAYVTGSHSGGSLPTTPGAFQTSASGVDAAFVAKFNATGSELLYSTYLAGNSQLGANTVAVDGEGDAYVAGNIMQNVPNLPSSYPTTPGAFQTSQPDDAVESFLDGGFVTKLNAAGSALVYSTLLYASDNTGILSLAVDPSGAAVVAGTTNAFDFPTTPGALRQCNPGGNSGTFVLKFAPDGSHPLYSTYLGSDSAAGGRSPAIAVDGAGDIYITGSSIGSLPVIPGSFGWTGSGALVARLTPVPMPPGSVSCVVNAAGRSGPAIAPGEIVDIFGNGIGPTQAVSALVSSGHIDTSLGGVQVLFNSGWGFPSTSGVLAPLLWAGPNQIRAIVPFEIGPSNLDRSGTATIQVLNTSTTVQPFTAPTAALSPAIFTIDGTPVGRALMMNEDGTLNSEKNPARQGSIVTIYATGLNNTQPPLATGAIATDAAPLALPIQIFVGGLIQIDGSPSSGPEVTYAGAAPGFSAGLTQINFRVPVSILHGSASLSIQQPMQSSFSQGGVYFYMQ